VISIFYAVLAVYFILGTAISLLAKRGIANAEDYYIGGRKIGGIVSALTYAATTYSAFMMVGLVGFTYVTGVGSAGFELMYFVGTIFLLSFYAERIWKISKEKGFISPAEFFKEKFGDFVAKSSVFLSLVALIPYTSIQFIGMALIFEQCLGISYWHGILLAIVLVFLWAFVGGLRSVAWTDALQGIIMIAAAVLAVIWTFKVISLKGIIQLPENLVMIPNEFWTLKRYLAFVTPWFFFSLTNPQVFQRLFILKDRSSIRTMVKYFGTFGLVYTILVTLFGLELRILSELDVFPKVSEIDKVTPIFLTFAPETISALIMISVIAASVTTANSIILTLSSMVSRDIVKSDRISIGRLSILILTLLCAIFALHRPYYIVKLAVLSSTLLLSQLPLVVGAIHFKFGGKVSGMASLFSGFVSAIALSSLKLEPLGVPIPIWVIFISFISYFVALIYER